MSEREFRDGQGHDEFEQLISGVREEVGDTITYNERDGYYAVHLRPDIAMFRTAFSDHVKAYHDLAPGEPIPDDYYEIVDHYLNTVDVERLTDMKKGDIVSTISPALFVKFDYFEGKSVDYDSVGEVDRLIGQYHRVVTLPLYSEEFDTATGMMVQTRSFEPMLVLVNPAVEDASGEMHDLSQLLVCVPFMSADVQFVKRVYQERNL